MTATTNQYGQTVLRCSTLPDLIASLPLLAGFEIDHSVIITPIHGTRVLGAMRFNLPAEDTVEATTDLIESIVTVVTSIPTIRAVAVVIFCDRGWEVFGEPYVFFARRLEQALCDNDVSVRELAWVGKDVWGDYNDPHEVPRRLDEVHESDAGMHATFLLDEPLTPFTELGELPAFDSDFSAALSEYFARAAPLPGDTSAMNSIADAIDHVSAHGSRADLEASTVVLQSTAQPFTWALLAVGVTLGIKSGSRLIREASTWDAPLEAERVFPSTVAGFVRALSIEPSGRQGASTLKTAVADLAANAPLALQPGMLTFSAWLWWMEGLMTPAYRQLSLAQEIDPNHELAHALTAVMTEAPPQWIFTARALQQESRTMPETSQSRRPSHEASHQSSHREP